jgi:hypothetical protein
MTVTQMRTVALLTQMAGFLWQLRDAKAVNPRLLAEARELDEELRRVSPAFESECGYHPEARLRAVV